MYEYLLLIPMIGLGIYGYVVLKPLFDAWLDDNDNKGTRVKPKPFNSS